MGGLRDDLPLADALWDLYGRFEAEGYRRVCVRDVFVHNGAFDADDGADYDARAHNDGALRDRMAAGNAAVESGDLERALSEFSALAVETPELPAVLAALGDVQMALKRPAEAKDAFRKALALAPEDAALHNRLGLALARCGDCEAAAAAFHQARALDGGNVAAYLNMVELHRSREDYVGASDALREAVERFPHNGDVLAAFATLKLEVGGAEAARLAVAQLKSCAPEHPALPALLKAIGKTEPAQA